LMPNDAARATRGLRRAATRAWRRDAAIAVILTLTMSFAFRNLHALLTLRLPTYFVPDINLFPEHLETWSPGLAFLYSAIIGSVLAIATLAVVIAVFRSGWSQRAWWVWAALLLLIVSLGPSHAHSVRGFLIVWIYQAVSFVAFVWIIAAFYRDNALAYVAAIFAMLVVSPVIQLLSQAASLYRWNGLLLGALSLAILGWLLLPNRSDKFVGGPSPPAVDSSI